jgi:hypothetical protein
MLQLIFGERGIGNAEPRGVMASQGDSKVPEHVARLLASSVETVERLDLLLYLRGLEGKAVAAKTVANARQTSIVSTEQNLAILCGRGFLTVNIGNDLLYAYQPISPTIDAVLGEVDTLVRDCREDVLKALLDDRGRDPVRAFANAFLVSSVRPPSGRKKNGG